MEKRRALLMSRSYEWGAKPQTPFAVASLSPEIGEAPNAHVEIPSNISIDAPLSPLSSISSSDDDDEAHMEPEPIEERTRSKIFISSKDWTLNSLLQRGERFVEVPRISVSTEDAKLHTTIRDHAKKGVPLVIEGLHNDPRWPKEFDLEWFRKNGQQDAKARNVHTWSDIDITLSELIEKQRAIATSVAPNETERLYGKDAHCPEPWSRWVNESGVIPHFLAPESSSNLLEVLPEKERVETLMCYLGIGDTFTPCHKDLCASSGQNVMCYTENGGSSFWFMTESSSAPAAAEYFHKLGQELDLETHVITVEELAEAPFKVYVVEQRLGDMVLVPPRSCHQVVNHGGITIKTSWSRMTLAGLTTALYHELPLYRRVCRSETYRVKETIHQALLHYTNSTSINAAALRSLINLFDDVLLEEYSEDHAKMPHVLPIKVVASSLHSPDCNDTLVRQPPHDIPRVTCDFCDTDIFQSFFECKKCVPDEDDSAPGDPSDELDGLIICPQCYVEGRTCRCGVMKPTQYRAFSQLLLDRNTAMSVLTNSGPDSDYDTVLDERDLVSEFKFSVFRSACAVHRYRKKLQERSMGPRAKVTRSCRHGHRYTNPHTVHYASVLHCKLCHAGKCFDCILSLGIHSAEAAFIHLADPTHQAWHGQHKGKERLTDIRRGDLEAEMMGARCDMRNKLTAVAANFKTCSPSKHDFIKPGWYDKFIQISNDPTDEGETQAVEQLSDHVDGMVNNESSETPMSELSILPSDEKGGTDWHTSPTSAAIADSPTTKPQIAKKRKREVLDYVLIPSFLKRQPAASLLATNGQRSHSVEAQSPQNGPHRHHYDGPYGARRVILSLPESTPDDCVAPLAPDSYEVDEQPAKKKVRSSKGPPGLRDVEFEAGRSSAFVFHKPNADIPSTKADLASSISHSAGPSYRKYSNYKQLSTLAGRSSNMDRTHSKTRGPRLPRNLDTTVRELVRGLLNRIEDLEFEKREQDRRHQDLSRQFSDLREEMHVCKSHLRMHDRQNTFNFEQRRKSQQGITHAEEGVKHLGNQMDKKFSEVEFEMAEIRTRVQENSRIEIDSRFGPHVVLQAQAASQPQLLGNEELNAIGGTRGQRSLPASGPYTQNHKHREDHENTAYSETAEFHPPREPRSHRHQRVIYEREGDHGYSQSGPSSAPFLPRHQLQLNNNEWHSEILPSSQSPKDSSPRLPRRNSQTGKDYSAHPTRRPQPSSPPKDYATSLCSTQRELSRGPHISPGLNRNEIPSPRSKQRDRQNSDYSRGSRTRSKSGHRAEYLQSPSSDYKN